jgi:hypothetical protein
MNRVSINRIIQSKTRLVSHAQTPTRDSIIKIPNRLFEATNSCNSGVKLIIYMKHKDRGMTQTKTHLRFRQYVQDLMFMKASPCQQWCGVSRHRPAATVTNVAVLCVCRQLNTNTEEILCDLFLTT